MGSVLSLPTQRDHCCGAINKFADYRSPQARMERLEIEPASSDASSTILAAWPDQMTYHQVAAASSSSMRMQPSTGKAALAVAEAHALVPGSEQPSRMGKDTFWEALIQPSVQTHIQVQLHAAGSGPCFISTSPASRCLVYSESNIILVTMMCSQQRSREGCEDARGSHSAVHAQQIGTVKHFDCTQKENFIVPGMLDVILTMLLLSAVLMQYFWHGGDTLQQQRWL